MPWTRKCGLSCALKEFTVLQRYLAIEQVRLGLQKQRRNLFLHCLIAAVALHAQARGSVLVPIQYSESTQSVPMAGAAHTGFHIERDEMRVGTIARILSASGRVIRRAPSVLMSPLCHYLDRLGGAFVRFGAGSPQVVQSTQHVVEASGRNAKRIQRRSITSPE